MKRKLTGSTTAAISMFLISGVLASVLGARQFERFTTHEVIGVNGNWPTGTQIDGAMLRKVRVNNEVSGIKDPRLVLGKQLDRPKRDGEIIRPAELKRPIKSWLAQQVPEGKVLYTLSPKLGSIPHNQLRNGDSFDVIATGRRGVRTIARDVRLVGVLSGKTAAAATAAISGFGAGSSAPRQRGDSSLVVAVAPEYIYPLASIGQNDNVSIVLHGAYDEQADNRPTIDPRPTQRQVEVVSGLSRKMVSVAIPAS